MSKNVRKLDPLVSCFVPVCKNSVMNSPNKHFFYVPRATLKQWCAAVNKKFVPCGSTYICEDHLNIEDDLLNYNDWITNRVTRPRLKLEVPGNLKNIRLRETEPPSSAMSPSSSLSYPWPMTQEKSVQCTPISSNKALQVKPSVANFCVSTKRPIKAKTLLYKIEEESSDTSLMCPSSISSTIEFSSSTTDTTQQRKKHYLGRTFILNLIEKKPFAYIGVPKQYFWIIKYLSDELKILSINIIIVFYKIKNNETFARMKDLFELSLSTLWRIFYRTLKALSKFFNQFIYWPNAADIKRNLPNAFTTNSKYASIQTIIDCFEIETEKPQKPIEQALTWSSYKNCNSIKILIGTTPDGLINFISEGYGGRITDMYLVEQSGFLECIPNKATILADRGFKHLKAHLVQKSVTVLRPPTVLKDVKMTKAEVIDSKVLASLRIHVERLIRRLRMFKILKPHAVINNKLIHVLNDIVVVACGLTNLQSSIIKNK